MLKMVYDESDSPTAVYRTHKQSIFKTMHSSKYTSPDAVRTM